MVGREIEFAQSDVNEFGCDLSAEAFQDLKGYKLAQIVVGLEQGFGPSLEGIEKAFKNDSRLVTLAQVRCEAWEAAAAAELGQLEWVQNLRPKVQTISAGPFGMLSLAGEKITAEAVIPRLVERAIAERSPKAPKRSVPKSANPRNHMPSRVGSPAPQFEAGEFVRGLVAKAPSTGEIARLALAQKPKESTSIYDPGFVPESERPVRWKR